MAWSAVGHKVVAHIAYDHLTPQAKKAVDQLTEEPGKYFSGRSRFVYVSTWADWSRDRGDARFRRWHYISLPLSEKGWPTKNTNPINAIYGINHCRVVLKNAQSSLEEQQTCLKLLVHIVGDIHQPLHTVNRYSFRHPKGDGAGNSYPVKSKVADNLHALWDRGLGAFKPFQRRKPQSGLMIKLYAEGVQQRYPLKHYSGAEILSSEPIEWAREGQKLAEDFVYRVPEFSSPSESYMNRGKAIAEERLALAGYRLAALLNTIYSRVP